MVIVVVLIDVEVIVVAGVVVVVVEVLVLTINGTPEENIFRENILFSFHYGVYNVYSIRINKRFNNIQGVFDNLIVLLYALSIPHMGETREAEDDDGARATMREKL